MNYLKFIHSIVFLSKFDGGKGTEADYHHQ